MVAAAGVRDHVARRRGAGADRERARAGAESDRSRDRPRASEGRLSDPRRRRGRNGRLADLLRHDYRVHVFDQPTVLGGEKFAKGTLLLRTGENPETLHEAVRRVAVEYGLSVLATDTALVDEGAGLGGENVSWVKPPRIAMLVDRPASPYSGHTWFLFDQVWRYPLTRVPGSAIAALDLSKYNVLILPDGRYPGSLGEPFLARLKDWVGSGGTLILVKRSRRMGDGEIGRLACQQAREESRQERGPSRRRKHREGERSLRARPRPSRTLRRLKNRPTPCRERFCVPGL